MRLPDEVESITSQYLALVDDVLPGRVVGFYLTGSIPLGDFRPGRSDIDGVVIVDAPVTEAEVRPVHEKLAERPYFDVTYLTAAAVAVPPDRSTPVVHTIDGEFKDPAHGGPVSPVLCLEQHVADVPDDHVIDGWIIPWYLLGIPRLHALLATGNIISKTAAGEHARTTFPRYTTLCTQALNHRAGAEITFTAADAREAITFGRTVITSAADL